MKDRLEINKVKESTITVNLIDAKRWYNSGNDELRKLAHKAFDIADLEPPKWSLIKTWKDACDILNVPYNLEEINYTEAKNAAKVQMIRKLLNEDYDMKLFHGVVYFPKFILTPKENVLLGEFCGTIIIDEPLQKNNRVNVYCTIDDGFGGGISGGLRCDKTCTPMSCYGYLGCATWGIAKHFGKYFYFEILASYFGDRIHKV